MKNIPVFHWVSIIILAALAIYFAFTSKTLEFSIFKGATTILILSIPFLYGDKPMDRYSKLISGGLIFCLGGDLLLLNEGLFVFGLLSFLIAHLLFLLAFFFKSNHHHSIGVLGILSFIGASYYYFLLDDLGDLSIPVLIYIVVIILMAWRGINLARSHSQHVYKLIGLAVLLFMISDALIAFNKFKMSFELSSILILSTYWLSIFLISKSTSRPS